jgi:hypothetical protein
MKIAIDISVPAGNLLLQTLASISTSELIPFYSKKTPLLKIFRETGAHVFILNAMCNYNDAQFLKANYGITIIHLGDDHQNVVADLVTGNSERFDSLGFDKLVDLKGTTKGQYKKEYASSHVCFTDSFERLKPFPVELVQEMISKKTKFFGSIRLDVPNYLGQVTPKERVDIICSADCCIDLSGMDYIGYLLAGSTKILSYGHHFSSLFELRMKMSKDDFFESEDHSKWVEESLNELKLKSYDSLVANIINYMGQPA